MDQIAVIRREKVDGKEASVAYLKADLTPVDNPAEAELLRVLFDNGDAAWLVPQREDEDGAAPSD
jgi:hypothetical protein